MEYRPIAAWLKKNRLAQINPAKRRPWTQAYLCDRIEVAIGWHIDREGYSRWETDKIVPGPDNLDKLIEFWATMGVPGPDLNPAPAPPEATESGDALDSAIRSQAEAIAALVAELQAERTDRARVEAERDAATRAYRVEMDARIAFLESMVRALRPRPANPGDRARPALPVTVE